MAAVPAAAESRAGPRLARLEGAGSGLLIAALTLYTAFNAGGYFADSTGVVAAALLLLLALRVAIVPQPLAGWSRPLAAAGGALALFAAWTLLSSLWSHAAGRAIEEFDRVLVYLLALVLFGASPWSGVRLRRSAYGVALAAVAVAVAALASRLAPDVFHTAPNIIPDRLSFPLTYWNALALLAGIGVTICLHFSCDLSRPPAGRALAAAAIPPLAVTLLLTYSRGGVAVTLLVVVAYLALARPRGAVTALAATVPPAAVAVAFAYGADRLASQDPASSAAAAQGHRVAVALVACTVVAAAVRLVLARRADGRLGSGWPAHRRTLPRRTRWALAAVAAVAIAVPLGYATAKQVEGFSKRPSATSLADTRNRLTDPSSNGRVDYWRAALDAFKEAPVRGTGAGTYQLAWWQHRNVPLTVAQGHSLYLQTLGELGVVGLVLLLAALGPLYAGLYRRMRGPDHALVAALLACAAGWAVHAAFDWDWQVPAVTLWLFAAGGLALARPRATGSPWSPGMPVRALLGVVLISAAVFPALVAVSQQKLDGGLDAYDRGACATASDDARTARDAMPARAEPRALLGYCAARSGDLAGAAADLRQAVARDPHDWEYRYGLAVVLAAGGRDPRPDVAAARRLDPLEPAIQQAAAAFAVPDPGTWKRRAVQARLFVDGLDHPPLGG